MSDINKDGGPAFSGYVRHHKNVAGQEYFEDVPAMGMSLRDYFAAAALTGMHSRNTYDKGLATPGQRAAIAYIDADAMLAEREKP